MIERWEDPANGLRDLPFEAPYALDREHKHVPEMTRYSGLSRSPHFVPAVGPFRCGMRVEISLHAATLPSEATPLRIHQVLAERYRDERFVRVGALAESAPNDEHALDPRVHNGTNAIQLSVYPNPLGHVFLVATLDNLGKGAAGAAVQNLNLMLGLAEATGLGDRLATRASAA
jgi:N-acetyl-gamma-glutamyl-phosphate reductase